MTRASLPPDYFEALYRADPDPWRFATSDYERAKYAATMAALPRPRFARALEIGCSIGVMTRRLAARCEALVAVDISSVALAQARERCAGLPHVSLAAMRVPADWPDASFDLIVASEVLYFLDAADIDRVADRIAGSLETGGVLMLVHWIGPTNFPTGGDAAVDRLIARLGSAVSPVSQARTADYRLDVLARV